MSSSNNHRYLEYNVHTLTNICTESVCVELSTRNGPHQGGDHDEGVVSGGE